MFLLILRSIYLKGSGFDVLWPSMAVVGAFTLITLGVSVLRFQKSVE